MTACINTMSYQSGYCSSCAAAGTSAREWNILGTALRAVSVFVIRLLSLLVLKL